jgi:hypothetical protein
MCATGVTTITLNPKLIPMVMVDRTPNYGDVGILNFQGRESPMVFCISLYSYYWLAISTCTTLALRRLHTGST